MPLRLDIVLLSDPIATYLPRRIRQGLIETYSLYFNDLENSTAEEEEKQSAIQPARSSIEEIDR